MLPPDKFRAPGAFVGEKEFIDLADRVYRTDERRTLNLRDQIPGRALIAVDLQKNFVNPCCPMGVPEAYRQIPRVRTLLEACREVGAGITMAHNIAKDCCADF